MDWTTRAMEIEKQRRIDSEMRDNFLKMIEEQSILKKKAEDDRARELYERFPDRTHEKP